jgi:hypothetical protein
VSVRVSEFVWGTRTATPETRLAHAHAIRPRIPQHAGRYRYRYRTREPAVLRIGAAHRRAAAKRASAQIGKYRR